MGQLERTLSLRDGTVLAIGSIAGSGILFLPSLTYLIAGQDVMLSWLGAMALCVPMLFMFSDMVHAVPDGSGIQGCVARGLGRHFAASVPLLFLALFSIGMPAAALVAGDYLAEAVGVPQLRVFDALTILALAVAINLTGVRTGARVQNVVTWGLLGTGMALIGLTIPRAAGHYAAVRPGLASPWPVLSGVVAAFWAFAGFENLIFIAGEFKNPRCDFFLAMLFAFAAYGVLAVAVTANIAGIVPRGEVNQLSGLLQLAQTISPRWLATATITVFAVALMVINATSWMWEMSRLIFTTRARGPRPASCPARSRDSMVEICRDGRSGPSGRC